MSARSLLLFLLAVGGANASASDQAPADAAPAATVACPEGAQAAEACTVDKDTYFGWRTYAANCQVCHGGSGLGSTFAPNLLDRLNNTVDHARFMFVLENGYTGQVGAMPAWKSKQDVMKNADNLYRYLHARAAGQLPPGRPEKAKP